MTKSYVLSMCYIFWNFSVHICKLWQAENMHTQSLHAILNKKERNPSFDMNFVVYKGDLTHAKKEKLQAFWLELLDKGYIKTWGKDSLMPYYNLLNIIFQNIQLPK